MPCLFVLLAFFGPRVTLAVLLVLTNVLETTYQSIIWPLLGFFFAPVLTLAYAAAIRWNGNVTGFYAFLCVMAALVDLGVLGGGVRTRSQTVRNYL